MVKSIQHFNEISVEVFERIITEFYKHPTDMASFVHGLTEELHKVGILLIQETLEEMDTMLCESGKRLFEWVIEQHNTKHLLTSLGEVTFKKTLFTNKKTGEMRYLLDQILGLEKGERITEDAEAAMLEEAVQTSYRRGGEAASILDKTSKQTVKKKIHHLQFPPMQKPEQKKEVEYLYVEADEDHIALQFREKKGDLVRDENGRKNNNAITKLVYVHEGIMPEAPKSTRYRLINPHYFAGTAKSISNALFWKEIYEYIDSHYVLEKVKKIYVSSDGGGWIKAGAGQLGRTVHVLDQFHLEKNIGRICNHMKDSAADVSEELHKLIRGGTKQEFRELLETLKEYFPNGEPSKRFLESGEYILSNWTAARYRLRKAEGVIGSSTEGHVSHVLASRMSTRAMGWSLLGADKMARLRVYYLNGGKMLDLVRFQKQAFPKAAGAEDMVFSASQVMQQEKKHHGILGKYHDAITHSIGIGDKKKIWFQSHIWGL